MKLHVRPVQSIRESGRPDSICINGDEEGLRALRDTIDSILERKLTPEDRAYDQGYSFEAEYPGVTFPVHVCVRLDLPSVWDRMCKPPVCVYPRKKD